MMDISQDEIDYYKQYKDEVRTREDIQKIKYIVLTNGVSIPADSISSVELEDGRSIILKYERQDIH